MAAVQAGGSAADDDDFFGHVMVLLAMADGRAVHRLPAIRVRSVDGALRSAYGVRPTAYVLADQGVSA